MRTRALALAIVTSALCAPTPVHAGGPLLLFDPATRTPLTYPAGTVDVFTDLGDLGPMLTNAEADALTAGGFAAWTLVSTSSFSAAVAGDFGSIGLPDITSANAGTVIGVFNGGGIHVIYDTDGTILSDFFGAPPGVLGMAQPDFSTGATITESWAVINGAPVDPGDPVGESYAGVFTHEFGHAINLAHAQANGAIGFFFDSKGPTGCTLPYAGSPVRAQMETMYPFIDISPGGTGMEQATVDLLDDVASLSTLYPATGWPASFGTISGTIFEADGVTELTGVNVIARNVADPFGDCTSALSGDLTQGLLGADGLYTLNGLTPGADYVLYVDRILAGGFSTPPATFDSDAEEFFNGGSESNNPITDDRCDFTSLVPTAGSQLTADVILNGILATAQSGVCYATTGNDDDGRILRIDPTTGVATLLSDPSPSQVPGVAINSAGEMFISDAGGVLYRVDPFSGLDFAVGATGVSLASIAFDENDVLYGVSNVSAPFGLYTIDPSNAVATLVGNTPDAFAGIAFDPTNGDLYASVSGPNGGGVAPDGIFLVDKTTGSAALIGQTGLGGGTPDIHFDSSGNLFGTKGGGQTSDDTFISIDKATGAGTVVGLTGFEAVSGLAFVPCGPAAFALPSSLDFTVEVDATAMDSFDVYNFGGGGCADLVWTLTEDEVPGGGDCAWLTVTPTSGGSPPGGSTLVEVSIDASGLAPGGYDCYLLIESNDPETEPLFVLVELTVSSPFTTAIPGICYGITGAGVGSGQLITLDPTTGAGTLVGDTGEFVTALAIDLEGRLYVTTAFFGELYRVDATTAQVVFVAATDLEISAMTFDAAGTLYGHATTSSNDANLVTIDPSTGASVVIGETGTRFGGLAFDPTTGVLYGSPCGQCGYDIYTVDTTTGAATLVGATGLDGPIGAIHFDDAGNLFGTTAGGEGPNDLVAIDKATGLAESIGPTGFTGITGLDMLLQSCTPDVAVTPPSIVLNVPINGIVVDLLEVANASGPECSIDWTLVDQSSSPRAPGGTDVARGSGSCPWLVASPTSGSTAGGSASVVDILIDTTGLSAGTYHCELVIQSNDPDEPEVTVPVRLDVNPVIVPGRIDVCYAATGNADGGRLLTIDPVTGAATLLGGTGRGGIPALAINSIGELFGADADGDIYRIDGDNAASVLVGGTGESITALAFDAGDQLYGVSRTGPASLFTIDPGTGAATLVGPTPDAFAGLAFDPTDGDLYASVVGSAGGGSVPDGVYLVNTTNGSAALVGQTGLGDGTPDVLFDSTGNLFGVVGGGQSSDTAFISIDKQTGAGTVIGSTGFASVSGLAYLALPWAVSTPPSSYPSAFALRGATPNPFNPLTRIGFDVPRAARVRIHLFNLAGQRVTTILDDTMSAGFHEVPFQADGMASGVYFYEMRADDFREVRKMTLLK